MNRLNSQFWSDYFNNVFSKQISDFYSLFSGRVLLSFSNIETEAETAAEQEWQRLMNQPADEYADMGTLAEQAEQIGISIFSTLEAMRQSMVNLAATALYHIFEQQILFFHRRQVLHQSEQNNLKLINMKEFKQRLSDAGVDYETFPSWKKVTELRSVANAIKHAEGQSASELRTLRPDLFEHPAVRKTPILERLGTPDVFMPLAGRDIYLTTDDLDAYQLCLCKFWEEFADALMELI